MKSEQKAITLFLSFLIAALVINGCQTPTNDKKGAATFPTATDSKKDIEDASSEAAPASSQAELPVVQAKSSDTDKYVDWGTKPIESNDGPADPWTMSNMMCQGPPFLDGQLKASSTLAAKGKHTYAARNICDDDPTTAWVEGKSDYGIGEYLEMEWTPMGDGAISILNGYQASKSTWEDNSRVKKMKVSVNNTDICTVALNDVMGAQIFEIPGLVVKNKNGYEYKLNGPIRFTILEVYPGLKWKDTAISGMFSCGG